MSDLNNYNRTVTLSKRQSGKQKYIAKVSPTIETKERTIREIKSSHPFLPLIEIMKLFEIGEFYERSQQPEFDEDVNQLERLMDLSIVLNHTFIGTKKKRLGQVIYLSRIFARPEENIYGSVKDPEGKIWA